MGAQGRRRLSGAGRGAPVSLTEDPTEANCAGMMSALGRVRESGAVGSRHSIGLRCPMATASIELALWKPPRHAHAAGYVCTTLKVVIGVTISLAPG